MPGTRHLQGLLQALEIVPPSLRPDLRYSSYLGDHLGHFWPTPDPVIVRRKLQASLQVFELLGGEQTTGLLGPLTFAAIAQAISAITVVVSHHRSGIVVVKTYSFGSIGQRRVGVNQPQQMPASRLDRVSASPITYFEFVG
jgi:hypothetical protein